MNAATSPDAHDAARRRQVRQVAAQEAAPDRRAQGASSPRRRTAPEIAGRGGAARQARGARRGATAVEPALSPRELRDRIGAATRRRGARRRRHGARQPRRADGDALYWLARCCASGDPPRKRRRARRAGTAGEPPEQTAWPRRARGEQGGVSAGKLLQRAGADAERLRCGALAAVTDCCVRGATASTRRRWRPCCTRTRGGCAPAEASLRALQQRAATLASDGDFNPQDRPTPCGRLPSWCATRRRAGGAGVAPRRRGGGDEAV